MPRIYYKGDQATFMDIMDVDLQHWLSQGWTQQSSTAGSTPSAPPAGVSTKPDSSQRLYLVQFSADPTPGDATTGAALPWLYDTRDRIFRPFKDQNQFVAWVTVNGGDPATAASRFVTLKPEDVQTGGAWAGEFLSLKYSPSSEDGSLPVYGAGSSAVSPNVTERYGLPYDEQAETIAARHLSMMVTRWKELGILNQESLTQLRDPKVVAKYVSAIAYGGYLFQDIWRDFKINELAKTNSKYTALNGIDERLPAEDFYKTDDYVKAIQTDPALMPPAIATQGGIDLMKYPVYKMPDEFFKEQVPTIDWRDPKFQAEAEKIAAGVYDLILAQTEAKTEQDRRIADDNFRRFIEATNKNYNLQLSFDAEKAWAQILDMQNTFENRGLSGSGVLEETRDRHLKALRKKTGLDRENFKTKSELTLRDRLLGQASSSEIKDSIAKLDAEDLAAGKSPDQYRSVLWGLVPDAATKAAWSIEALKKAYPMYTDEQIQLIRDSFIDENGNYRSKFYQVAITNKLNNRLDKMEYQRSTYQQDQADLVKKKNDDLFNAEFTNYQSPESKRIAKEQADAIAKEQADLAYAGQTATQQDQTDVSKLFEGATQAQQPPPPPPPAPKKWSAYFNEGGQYKVVVDGVVVGTYADPNQAAQAAQTAGAYIGSFGRNTLDGVTSWAASSAGQDTIKSMTGATSTSTSSTPAASAPQTTWTPPAGMEIINGALYNTRAAQEGAYSNIQTSPDGKHLYGTKKATTTGSSTPTSSSPTPTPTPTSTTVLNNTGIWKPPAGMEIINGALYNTRAAQEGAYSNIQTSPDGKNLYGTKKTTTSAPAQTTTTPASTPTTNTDPGYVQVKGPSGNVMRVAEGNLSIWLNAGYTKV